MATHAFTLRLPTHERQALENLSRVEGRPMNQILNDAIKAYLHRQSDGERILEESLQKLRVYRERDPDYKEAIATVATAEAAFPDPLEGTLVRQQQQRNHPATPKPAKPSRRARPDSRSVSGSLQTRVQDLLNA